MNDTDKTKDQLIGELAELRRRNAELLNRSLEGAHGQVTGSPGLSQGLLDMIIEAAPT